MKRLELRPVLVVSDLHFSRSPSLGAHALAELLANHPEHELVVAGDCFDLAFDSPRLDPSDSIAEILSTHVRLSRVLAERLARGVPVTLLAGNHDAAVASGATRVRLLASLGLDASAPLTTFPWFIRRGDVHIEHGHFYDPDNAPNHPLCLWSYQTEPLGIAMTRRFVAPNGAMMFAGAYEVTPLAGLLQVLMTYRLRAPLVIAHYFATAGGICVRARTARHFMAAELARGAEVVVEHSRQLGVDASMLEQLLGAGARPTHQRFRDTFMRLYFDRIFAALGSFAGVGIGLLGNPFGFLLTGLGACYLGLSVQRHGSRYQHLPGTRLRHAAMRVSEATGASTVIFGHTHVEDGANGYVNLGSFAFSRDQGRPYIELDSTGQAHRRRFV